MVNNKFFTDILETIFPVRCVNCHVPGNLLCSQCAENITYSEQCCIGCGKANITGNTCMQCLKKTPLLPERLICAVEYAASPARKMMINFKYAGIKNLSNSCAKIIFNFLCARGWQNQFGNFVICYVPLHKSKNIMRGFNQSELIALDLGKIMDLPVLSLLVKTLKTKAQLELNRNERQENIKGAFFAAGCSGKNILLIDDVITTGSTIKESAKVLKQNGAASVTALVFAKD